MLFQARLQNAKTLLINIAFRFQISAGYEVTAMGVIGDLIKVISQIC